jgi:uncharacterized protein
MEHDMAKKMQGAGKLSVVTGASTGIGLELAKLCAKDGFDLIIAADEPRIEQAAAELHQLGATVTPVETDLSTTVGVDRLLEAIRADGRPVHHLMANAGRGLGHGFLDQDFEDILLVLNTNVTGTIYMLHKLLPQMVAQGEGHVLITGSIAGILPGSFQAVYNGTKAFIDNFAYGLRNELKDTGVSISLLMPGPTDTEFFERGDMMDTKVGQDKKMDAGKVAKIGYEAMMKGEASVVAGVQNKIQAAMAQTLPKTAAAEQHRKLAEPKTDKKAKIKDRDAPSTGQSR